MIKRKLFSQITPYFGAKEAILITGMRRTGKTSLLKLIDNAIPSSNKLFLDLENPLNQKYFEEPNYERIKSTLELLGLRFTETPYLFLDEIQEAKNLPSVLKYLIDHYAIKCFLTGSASFYLKNLFTESLVGRKYLFELFPLDFEEFLWFKASPLALPPRDKPLTRPIFDTFSNEYEEYLGFGGFPEVVLKKNHEEKKKSLEDIFTSYFQMEVSRLGDFRKNQTVRDLMLLLIERIGSQIDFTKLASELGTSRITLREYLAFLEDTYFIKLIKPFSRNRDLEIRKMPKVYLCDSGLANHHAKISEGALFENNVFQTLRIQGDVHYYQRKSGAEIDFILNKKTAFETKLTAAPHDLKPLENLCRQIGIKDFKLVTRRYPRQIADHSNVTFPFLL